MSPRPKNKTISAMVRIKNEEEFAEASISSIMDLVDEVVIVDNRSSDRTPEIIDRLAKKHPDKVRIYTYDHELAKQGQENAELASSYFSRFSPRSLANFYIYCMKRCTRPYILKWDADTLATEAMARALERFRKNDIEILWHIGANIHENRKVLIAGHPYEDMEPRMFRKQFATYDNSLRYFETFQSPFLREDFKQFEERCEDVLYVHMKYCKSNRFSNMSVDLQNQALEDNKPGAPASRDILDTLARWNCDLKLAAPIEDRAAASATPGA